MSFYIFIAISFYRNIAILCEKMSLVNKALLSKDYVDQFKVYLSINVVTNSITNSAVAYFMPKFTSLLV